LHKGRQVGLGSFALYSQGGGALRPDGVSITQLIVS
jgi:hypothetical protein